MILKTAVKRLLGDAYRWVARTLEIATERRLNIDTAGSPYRQNVDHMARNLHYEPIPYAALRKISRLLTFGPDDVICDLGCGKGRILCWFATLTESRCFGVDIDEVLIAAARNNIARLAGRLAPIEVHVQDATQTPFANVTVVIMFNPFGKDVLRAVLSAMCDSLRQSPRALTIIYINPVHLTVFEGFPQFQVTDCFSYLYNLVPTATVVVMRANPHHHSFQMSVAGYADNSHGKPVKRH